MLLLDPWSGLSMPKQYQDEPSFPVHPGNTNRNFQKVNTTEERGSCRGRRRKNSRTKKRWKWVVARKLDSSCSNHKSESVSFHCRSSRSINQDTLTHSHTHANTQTCARTVMCVKIHSAYILYRHNMKKKDQTLNMLIDTLSLAYTYTHPHTHTFPHSYCVTGTCLGLGGPLLIVRPSGSALINTSL